MFFFLCILPYLGVDIRIFDEANALARNVHVENYASRDEHSELILYEGSFAEIEAISRSVHRKR
jgi:hypothetical protein